MKTFLAILSICLVSSSFSEAHILSDPVPNKQTVQIPQQCMPLYQKYVQLQQQYQVIHQYLLKLTSNPNQKVFIPQGSQSVGSLQRQVGGGSKDYVVRGSEKPSSVGVMSNVISRGGNMADTVLNTDDQVDHKSGLIGRVIEGAGQVAGDALRMTGDADTQKVFISQGSQSGGSRQRQGGDSVDYVVKGSETPSSIGFNPSILSRGGNVNTGGQVDYNSGLIGRVVEGAGQAAGDALRMTGDADTEKVFISQGSQSGGSRQRQVEGDSVDYIIKGSETPSSIGFNPSILSRGGNVNTGGQVDYNSGLIGRVVEGAGQAAGDALRMTGDADTEKVFISQGSQSGGSRQRQVEGDSVDYIIKGSETPSSISFNPSILSRGGNMDGIIVNTDDQVDSGLLGRVVDGAGHVVGDALRTAGDAVFEVDKGINNIFRNLRK